LGKNVRKISGRDFFDSHCIYCTHKKIMGEELKELKKRKRSDNYEGRSKSFATRPYRKMEMLQTILYFSI